MLNKFNFSHDNFIVAVIIGIFCIGYLGLYFFGDEKGKNKSAIPNCKPIAKYDVGDYFLNLYPKLVDGCDSYLEKNIRPLTALGLKVYMPLSIIDEEKFKNTSMETLSVPINKRNNETDVSINILITNRRILASPQDRVERVFSSSSKTISDLGGFDKYNYNDNSFEYVGEVSGEVLVISCFGIFDGGACNTSFNIFKNGTLKGEVKFVFDLKDIKYFFSINAYVNAIVKSMIEEKEGGG